ncbi:MAG: 2-dehydropantoate 2-reductase [Acidobacteriota bacterium]|nr:2-dehydropantoate 2-reductase [Acidobacteriota bacterium]
MKHAVLGAGAIGGLIGTALASLGEDVIVVVRPNKLANYPRTLTLERPSGTITAPARAVTRLTEPVDVLWISTRTYQLDDALKAIESAPKMIVPLLNGVDHIEKLRARFDHDTVVSATIAVEAERLAPGHFVQRSPFVRLNLASSAEPALGAIVARLSDMGFTCQFMANEQTLLWSKLCFLAPMALTSSASGRDKGGMFAEPEWKRKLYSAVDEACAVARASGAEVDAAKILAFIESLPNGMRSSMQKDVGAGRQLELDGIGGPIVHGGERYGIPVPATKGLMAEIRANTAA